MNNSEALGLMSATGIARSHKWSGTFGFVQARIRGPADDEFLGTGHWNQIGLLALEGQRDAALDQGHGIVAEDLVAPSV
jgi:hypothetical protein